MLGDFTSAAILEMRFPIPNEMVASKNPSERSSSVVLPACATIFPIWYYFPVLLFFSILTL